MPILNLIFYSFLTASFSSFAVSNTLNSNTEIQSHTIKLGMSNALSGPTSSLGNEIKKGASVYFKRINEQGGINGQLIELTSLDDGYEPENAVNNTKSLIEKDVLALFGYVGTPTSYAIMPILKNSKIPYLMPFTGADFLRTADHSNIFNLRASYYQEVAAQIDYLIDIKKFSKIALILQADEFGLTAQRAVNKVLKENELNITVTARFRRNTDDIITALAKVSAQPIDAVIFVGTYQPFIHLINLAHKQNLDVVFTSLSFIGSHNILNKIPESSKVILSEVVPAPNKCNWQLCQQFIADMNNAGYSNLNRVQLEGYLNAFVFSQVAKHCGENLNRQCLLKQFEQFNYQDNTLDISFSKDNHQGLQQVYFSFSKAITSPKLSSSLTH